PDALKPYAVPWLIPNVGNWSAVWRYTVLVPVQQIHADGTVQPVASEQDVVGLELMCLLSTSGTSPGRRGAWASVPGAPGGRSKLGKRTGTKCSRCPRPRPPPPTSVFKLSALNCKRRWSKGKC